MHTPARLNLFFMTVLTGACVFICTNSLSQGMIFERKDLRVSMIQPVPAARFSPAEGKALASPHIDMDVSRSCEADVDDRPLDMQISRGQALMICRALRRPGGSGNFLVFSLGFDSAFWKNTMNQGGATIFLEDIPEWYNKIVLQHPTLQGAAFLVHYSTDAANWKEDLKLLEGPGSGSWLRIRDLPPAVTNRSGAWDTILVDAPMGTPKGRLQSIYEASNLVKQGGVIVVDDCNREVEREASQLILGKKGGGVMKRAVSRGGPAGNSQCFWEMP